MDRTNTTMSNDYEIGVGQRLFENRIVYLSGDVTTASADHVVSRILTLDSIDHHAEIKLYLSSYGGGVYPGLAIPANPGTVNQICGRVDFRQCLGPMLSRRGSCQE